MAQSQGGCLAVRRHRTAIGIGLRHHHCGLHFLAIEQFHHPHGQKRERQRRCQHDGGITLVLRLPGFLGCDGGFDYGNRRLARRLARFQSRLACASFTQQILHGRDFLGQRDVLVEFGTELVQAAPVRANLALNSGDRLARRRGLFTCVGQRGRLPGLCGDCRALPLFGSLALDFCQPAFECAMLRVQRQILGRVQAAELVHFLADRHRPLLQVVQRCALARGHDGGFARSHGLTHGAYFAIGNRLPFLRLVERVGLALDLAQRGVFISLEGDDVVAHAELFNLPVFGLHLARQLADFVVDLR